MVPLKEIIKRTYKEHKYGLAMRYIGRPLSYLLLWLLVPLRVTAAQVSLANIFLFAIPFVLIASGSRKLAIIGTSFLLFLLVLDCADGGLARFYKHKTLSGKYLECMFHEVCIPLLFFALSIYSFKYFGNYYMLLLGTITVFSIFLTSVSRLDKHRIVLEYSLKVNRLPAKARQHELVSHKSKGLIKKTVFYFLVIFNDTGHLFFILFLLSIFNLLQYAILFYFVFYTSIAGVKFLLELKSGFEFYGLE